VHLVHAREQPGSKMNAINFHPVQNAYTVQMNQIPSLRQVDDHPKVLHAMMTRLF
jgi:L-lysine 2,3-aminomutase